MYFSNDENPDFNSDNLHQLIDIYMSDIKELENLTGVDLSKWVNFST